ncbi:MAG: hypothetical protein JW755_03420, partial [Candidatus Aminicenantes bacterium]|nr:hypothetical protein [Candidatus Aminicenantes bacterium]
MLFFFISPFAFIPQDASAHLVSLEEEQHIPGDSIIDSSASSIKDAYIKCHTSSMPTSLPGNMGVWIHTMYDGAKDSVQLDIGLEKFILMLNGGGWVPYKLSMENTDDTTINLRFVRTKIFLDDGTEVDVVETNFNVDSPIDTTKSFEISLEVRFPFSLIEKKNKISPFLPILSHQHFLLQSLTRVSEIMDCPFLKNLVLVLQNIYNTYKEHILSPFFLDSSYFCARIGYASPASTMGPTQVETRFFFGRKNIWDPQVFRMKISPQDLTSFYPLSYVNSYLTVDTSGNEAFYQNFTMDFSPAAELQVTSIPRQARVRYDFGSSAGVATRISFHAQGGTLSDIIQSFLIDPLPAHMSFDLTVLGERSFLYESNQRYSVTYRADSQQNGTLVHLHLQDLPTQMQVEWGLKINPMAKTGSGFIDLDMSHNIGTAALYLHESSSPFLQVTEFPRSLRVDGYMDIPHLAGYIRASKYSDSPTTLSVPLSFGAWMVTSELRLTDGYLNLFWDLPTADDSHVALGLDTNNNAMLASTLSLVNTTTHTPMLSLSFEGLETDDLALSWRYDDAGKIKDFEWSGKVTKLISLSAMVAYQNMSLSFSGSWILGQNGSFELEFSIPIEVTFVNITSDQFQLFGDLCLYEDRYLKIEWELDRTGYFTIFTPEPLGESL